MLKRPDAVIFDFGGTLFDDDFDVRAGQRRMLELAEHKTAEIRDYIRLANEIDSEIMPRKANSLLEYAAVSFTRLVSDCIGISYEYDERRLEMEFWKASERCTLVDDVVPVLTELKYTNVSTGIISNMTFGAAVIEHELTNVDIAGLFDAIVTSADYGLRKPHPLLFRGMAGRLGVHPTNCWYVGDQVGIDVLGAQNAGMSGIWLNRNATVSPSDIIPDGVVKGWFEFADMWKGIG